MFTNIWYNYRSNKIYLTEKINGKIVRDSFDHAFDYYIPSEEKTDKQTIYGQNVIKKTAKSSQDLKKIKERKEVFQSDLPKEQKLLLERYEDKKIDVNIEDVNIAYIDIEVESGYTGFKKTHKIKVRKIR